MVDVDDRNEWKECIDIGGVRLPTGYFFGASAATGDLSGRSELKSFKHTTNNKEVIISTTCYLIFVLFPYVFVP